MGKVKKKLEEDIARYPELYNGYADYEFLIECNKKVILERESKPPIKLIKEKKCQNKRKK